MGSVPSAPVVRGPAQRHDARRQIVRHLVSWMARYLGVGSYTAIRLGWTIFWSSLVSAHFRGSRHSYGPLPIAGRQPESMLVTHEPIPHALCRSFIEWKLLAIERTLQRSVVLESVSRVGQLDKLRASWTITIDEIDQQLEISAAHATIVFSVQGPYWNTHRIPRRHQIEALKLLVVGSGPSVLLVIRAVPELSQLRLLGEDRVRRLVIDEISAIEPGNGSHERVDFGGRMTGER